MSYGDASPATRRLALGLAPEGPPTVEALAEAALSLPLAERVRLVSIIMQGRTKGPA